MAKTKIKDLKTLYETLAPIISCINKPDFTAAFRLMCQNSPDLFKAFYKSFSSFEAKFSERCDGDIKVVVYKIGDEFICIDFDKKTMQGSEKLIKTIKDANERLRGAEPGGYPNIPVGDLYSGWSLGTLIKIIFKGASYNMPSGKGDGKYQRMPAIDKAVEVTSYVLERYPENPLKRFVREELDVTPEVFRQAFPPTIY